jgi:hypothetical protein
MAFWIWPVTSRSGWPTGTAKIIMPKGRPKTLLGRRRGRYELSGVEPGIQPAGPFGLPTAFGQRPIAMILMVFGASSK